MLRLSFANPYSDNYEVFFSKILFVASLEDICKGFSHRVTGIYIVCTSHYSKLFMKYYFKENHEHLSELFLPTLV